MKVYIGKYRNWIGPWQVSEFLLTPLKLFMSAKEWNKLHEKFVEFIPDAPFGWWHKKMNNRTIKIRIDNWDVWSMDHTLSLIIVPMLKELKSCKHGGPNTDEEDLPEHLRYTEEEKNNIMESGDFTDKHFTRWDWIMDEMIWAHEQIIDDNNDEQFFSEYEPNEDVPEPSDLEKMFKSKPRKYDSVRHRAHTERIQNGLKLFGKYYQSLWD